LRRSALSLWDPLQRALKPKNLLRYVKVLLLPLKMMPFSVNQIRNDVVHVQGPLRKGHPADVKKELIQEEGIEIDPTEGLHLPAEIASARDLPQMSHKRGTGREGTRMTTTKAVTETASPAPLHQILTIPAVANIGSIVTSVLIGTTEGTHLTSPHHRAPKDLRRAPPYLPQMSSSERKVLLPKSDLLPRMLDMD
jgi:hypothetical protein